MIYDKEIESYFVARDAAGTRPLYYTIAHDQFYYSDDIGDLLIRSSIKKELDIEALRMLLYYNTIPYSDTMYKNIKRLPPGHSMIVDNDMQVKIERYWKPEEIKLNGAITEEDAKEKFLELFSQVISERINDFSKTAFDLSGGLDSSSIVSISKYMNPNEDICTISQSYPSLSKCDESVYIDAVEDIYDIDSVRVRVDNLDYKDDYSLKYNYRLNPYWPILVTHTTAFPIANRLKKMNINKVLTGQGGDELMAGNFYYLFDYFKQLRWIQLYRELIILKMPIGVLKRYVLLALLSEKSKKIIKNILQLFRFKNPENNDKNIPVKNFQEFCNQNTKEKLSFLNDINALVGTQRSLMFDICAYPVVSKHYGINFYHPFFDRRLMEFMLSLPGKYKYSEGEVKVLLRKAMKGILPEEIRKRQDKAEFTAVLKQQIDAIDLDLLLNDAYLVRLKLIEQKKIDILKEKYINGKMEYVLYFWKIINMEYWYRYNFVNNKEKT